ncbi:TIGR03826 family flagellar region protein [Oceanobacillus senegalensis]|uniref:TIGR03826 family flagellar region protein n=1 Tax=Oceanobacillus senegalensis TaxID=1936063 RepID=UPI000A30CB58|nr:TIGR03826 family flagellar region protein [Oceanobacillus senegalensis]
MADLANCSRCGAVFVKGIRDLCQNGYLEEEKAFQTVYNFLKERKNRQATMKEIVEATGVEERLITKFIREKRLLISKFPNLAYPCEGCGADITSGKLCRNCQESFKKDLQIQNELDKKLEQIRQKENSKSNTYYTLNKIIIFSGGVIG